MRKNVIPWIVSHLAAIISILFLPSGCLKEEVPYLTLSAEGEIEMDYDGGAFTVEVKTNQSWTAVSDAAWCAVSGGEGSYKGEFVITVEPNDGISGRKANITVSGGLCSEVITIVQTSQEADFSVSASEITFVNGADVYRLVVTSNYPWKAVSSSSWCTISADEGDGNAVVDISAEANSTGEDREAAVTFTVDTGGKSIVRTVSVRQSADSFFLELPVGEFSVGKSGGTLEATYLVGGEGVGVECTSGAEWITVASVSDGKAILEISENLTSEDRTAEVAFNTAGQSGAPAVCKISVTQTGEASALDLLVPEITLVSIGEEVRIPFVATGQVEARSSSDWCKASVQGDDIVISAEMNVEEDREAYVTVSLTAEDGKTLSKALKVMQPVAELFFEFDNSSISLSYDASTGYAQLNSTGEWKLNNTAGTDIPQWLTVSPTSGNGDALISLSVSKNQFNRERKTQLSFTNTLLNKSISLQVIQEANPNGIEDYKHLGKGYDASGEYAADAYVRNSILDIDKLIENGYMADVINLNSTEERYIYAKTMEEYQSQLSTKAGISANYLGFSASVSASFSEAALSSAENEYSSFRHITKKQSYKILPNLTAGDLKPTVMPEAQTDIDNMAATDLFLKYGTHVITGFVLGGSLDYSMSADVSVMEEAVDWSIATSGGFELLSMGGSASVEFSSYEKMRNEAANFESSLRARGGESQYASQNPNVSESTYNEWLASLEDQSKWVMIDYDGSQLIPIWEFASSPSRKSELEAAAKSYLAKPPVVQQTTHRTLTVTLLKIGYLSDDAGNTAELTNEFWYTVDGKQEQHLGKFYQEVPDNSGDNPDDWKNAASQLTMSVSKMSIYKDHSLVLRGHFIEDDTTGDDIDDGNIDMNYSAADNTWRLKAATETVVGNGDTLILTAGSPGEGVRAQFRFEWK